MAPPAFPFSFYLIFLFLRHESPLLCFVRFFYTRIVPNADEYASYRWKKKYKIEVDETTGGAIFCSTHWHLSEALQPPPKISAKRLNNIDNEKHKSLVYGQETERYKYYCRSGCQFWISFNVQNLEKVFSFPIYLFFFFFFRTIETPNT